MMPLFIDRLPFHRWTDATRLPPTDHWTVVLPILLDDLAAGPPPGSATQEWALDTGNRGEAFAWRHHLIQAGLDPAAERMPGGMRIQTAMGQLVVPVRRSALWLVSNIPALAATPYRIPLIRGLPFRDTAALPDPQFHRPLIGLRALRTAGVRVEIDFAADTVSVWTPDVP